MPDAVRLAGKLIEITDEKRARVQEELPEVLWIEDDDLRRKFTDAWVAALASSSFSRLGEMRASGNYDTPQLNGLVDTFLIDQEPSCSAPEQRPSASGPEGQPQRV